MVPVDATSLSPVDVLVVGAGAAGLPAAIAAARAGAKTLLLEEDAVVGGAAVDNFVSMPCGGPRAGIYAELVAYLQAHHRLPSGPASHGRREEEWFLPWAFQDAWHHLTAGEPNLRIITNARVRRPIVAEGSPRPRVTGVLLPLPDDTELAIHAHTTIDATGTGQIAHLAGCAHMYGRDARATFGEPHAPDIADTHVQQLTWMYLSQRLGTAPFDMRRLRMVSMMDSGFGWVGKGPEEFVARDSGFYLHWGCALECADTRDPIALSETHKQAFEFMRPDLELLRDNHFFVYLAPRLGVRESRRIVGEAVITELDVQAGRLPNDTIAIGSWYLDIWGHKGKLPKEERTVPPYGVPYRAILPRDVDGLLLAGKAISGSHIAMSSYRVQPTVAMAGQAAGVAAAMCAEPKCQPRDLDPAILRQRLTAAPQGVDLTPRHGWHGLNA